MFFIVGLAKIDYPDEVRTEYTLCQDEIDFFEKLYLRGLAEFRVRNRLGVDRQIVIKPDRMESDQTEHACRRAQRSLETASGSTLVFNGGGKDGLTTATVFTSTGIDFDWLNIGRSNGKPDGAQRHALLAFPQNRAWVTTRSSDKRKVAHKYRGHTPLNAGLALLGSLSALALDKQYVVASNELSANDGNGIFDGVAVNHQYSKSLEFEDDFRALLETHDIPVIYFSFLRPLHELQIMRIFSKFNNLHSQFSSCNRHLGSGTWCLNCPKCAFVTMSLAAFNPESASKLWGEDFLNTQAMIRHIRELVDPTSPKPFDCVGTLEESQLALKLVLQQKQLKLSREFKNTLAPFVELMSTSNAKSFFATPLNQYNIPSTLSIAFEQLRKLSRI